MVSGEWWGTADFADWCRFVACYRTRDAGMIEKGRKMSEPKKPGPGGPGGKQGSGGEGKVSGNFSTQPGGGVKNRTENRESPVIFPVSKPRPKG